jgi:RecA-family ATPase
MTQLPVQPAWRLAEVPEQRRWLVDQLWSEEAVGIIGGEPKCCKSFLALDLAVAVAAGTPCLRRFAVRTARRVLLYPAEDALHIVRRRLEGICVAAGVALPNLDIQVITAPSLRLHLDADRAVSRRPSRRSSRGSSSLIRSCICIASTRMSAARSLRCSPSCANCSGVTPQAPLTGGSPIPRQPSLRS